MEFFRNYKSIVFLEHPYRSFLNPSNGDIDFLFLDQYKNHLLILNFAAEHWNRFEIQVYRALEHANINFLMLTYNTSYHEEFSRMFYFPYWYVMYCELGLSLPKDKNKIFDIGVLNGLARIHRILNHIELVQKSYIEKISIGAFRYAPDDYSGTRRPDDNVQLLPQEQELWNAIPKKQITNYEFTFMNLNLPQLQESNLHLVMESSVLPEVFISEKTWKPIACKVPFLIYGNPGTMQFLKAQGIDTYDDVIDHKYYDAEPDPRLRLKKLHQVLDDIVLFGVNKIYQQLVPRMTINQNKFYNGEFLADYLQQIKTAITRYS